VQQEIFLFIGTIRWNIRYGAQGATDEEVIEAAKVARIHDFIMTLPDGYDTWVGERGVTLSGGQKQRISIARMLLRDPRILVSDDSTSSVDMETEYLIQQALNQLMEGRTTFVIAQRLRTVKNADQILVLRRGQIVERGRHKELLELNGLYRQIYDVELRDQETTAAVLDRLLHHAETVLIELDEAGLDQVDGLPIPVVHLCDTPPAYDAPTLGHATRVAARRAAAWTRRTQGPCYAGTAACCRWRSE